MKILNLDEMIQSKSSFLRGYGKFPFIIYKYGNAIYMQIPIHFNKNNDFDNYPGIHINKIRESYLAEYLSTLKGELHDVLIERSLWAKKRIESQTQKPAKLCLVESENIAYFIDENGVQFNSEIPSGGTLISQCGKMMGMNAKHFVNRKQKMD